MTTATAPATRPTQRFPRWFLRAPELVFGLHLGRLVPWWVMIVTTGRRSGKPRSVVLDVVRRDERGLWVIAADGLAARWVKNLIANPSCTVAYRGRRFAARAIVAAADPGDLVAEIYRVLARLNSAGLTVLLSEQNARMSLQASQRAYVLQEGRVALAGESRALLESDDVRRTYLGL